MYLKKELASESFVLESTENYDYSAITDPAEAAKVIVENYKRSLSGMELLFEVDREKGYS